MKAGVSDFGFWSLSRHFDFDIRHFIFPDFVQDSLSAKQWPSESGFGGPRHLRR